MNKPIKPEKIKICEEIETKWGTRWRFYCQKCKRYHTHGDLEGWRSSHCEFIKNEYYIKLGEPNEKI